jgi:hypothetical protein
LLCFPLFDDGWLKLAQPKRSEREDDMVLKRREAKHAARWARGALIASMLAPSMLAAACGDEPQSGGEQAGTEDAGEAESGDLELTIRAAGTRVHLGLHHTLTLTLTTIGPGQYGEPQLSSSAVRFVKSWLPALQNPGGPTQRYEFEAESSGTAEVSIPHSEAGHTAFALTIAVP